MMTQQHADQPGAQVVDWEVAYQRKSIGAIPMLLAVPVILGVACAVWAGSLVWPAVGIGVLGWMIALALRAPIGALLQRAPKDRAWPRTVLILVSGPCEEVVRLAALLVFGRAFPFALSLGFGWATVEVLYAVVQVVALAQLMRRTDEKALRAREILASQGMDKAAADLPAVTGAVERVSASALHIGFTMLIAAQPWLVLLTIPAHSLTNLAAVRLMRHSVLWTEIMLALIGAAALVAGGFAIGAW